jgi:hypothetical protein
VTLFEMLRRPGPLNVVLVQTKTGGSIKGVLVERNRVALVLRAAAIASVGINDSQIWSKAIGDLVIPMVNVDYWQEALPVTVLD